MDQLYEIQVMNKEVRLLVYIYSVRIYAAIITMALIPILIGEIGIEAYGLIGSFTVLQACLSILDAGVGGVLTRESILSKNDIESFKKFNALYKKIVVLFILIAIILAIAGWGLSVRYSTKWLNTTIESKAVISSTTLMFWIFALRYIQGPFRSILLSNESQITLTTINLIVITISQPIALFLLKIFHKDVVFYFMIQLVAAGLSCGLIVICSEIVRKKILLTCPMKNNDIIIHKASSIKKIISFSLQLSTLSILWVIVSQSDKLALTRFMPLSQYGMYSVAVSVISVLAILSDPLNQYLQPRLTKYYHDNDLNAYTFVYFSAFKFIVVMTVPLSAFLLFFSKQTIFFWSNDSFLANEVAKYLPWLFIGGVFAIYSNFIFLLLYSFGELKKHTLVYAIYSIFVVPLNVYIASKYLGEGTSVFFAVSSTLLFILWGGYNLKCIFFNGLNIFYHYLIPLFIIEMGYFWLAKNTMASIDVRWQLFIVLSSIGFIGVVIALLYLRLVNRLSSAISLKVVGK